MCQLIQYKTTEPTIRQTYNLSTYACACQEESKNKTKGIKPQYFSDLYLSWNCGMLYYIHLSTELGKPQMNKIPFELDTLRGLRSKYNTGSSEHKIVRSPNL